MALTAGILSGVIGLFILSWVGFWVWQRCLRRRRASDAKPGLHKPAVRRSPGHARAAKRNLMSCLETQMPCFLVHAEEHSASHLQLEPVELERPVRQAAACMFRVAERRRTSTARGPCAPRRRRAAPRGAPNLRTPARAQPGAAPGASGPGSGGACHKSPDSLASGPGSRVSGSGAPPDERGSMGTAETQDLLWRRKAGREQGQGLELGHLIGRGSFGAVYQGPLLAGWR